MRTQADTCPAFQELAKNNQFSCKWWCLITGTMTQPSSFIVIISLGANYILGAIQLKLQVIVYGQW